MVAKERRNIISGVATGNLCVFQLGMVVHTLNPNTWGAETDGFLSLSLIYIVNTRSARAAKWYPGLVFSFFFRTLLYNEIVLKFYSVAKLRYLASPEWRSLKELRYNSQHGASLLLQLTMQGYPVKI